ncbi:putative cytidine deaminase [Bacillus phage phi18]|nr:putative cytidine deaminase [Bacillus phage phi18]
MKMEKYNECKRMTVHAVGLDKDYNIVKTRNGNYGECKNVPGACGCTHAEIQLLSHMVNPVMVYVSHSPCLNCARELVKAGVKYVHYSEPYRIADGIEYLESNGVTVRRVSECPY